MKTPKTLFRVLNAHINFEKYVYVLMKNKMYEHKKHKSQWSTTSQGVFIAGMEFALEIMKDRAKYDVYQDKETAPLSDTFKNLVNINYRLKVVDKSLEHMVRNGSIKSVIK